MLKKINNFTLLYVIFILVLPFVYLGITIDPFLLPRQLFLSVFLLIVLMLIGVECFNNPQSLKIQFYSPHYVFVGLILVGVISISYAINTKEGLYYLSRYLIEFIFFIVTSILIYNNKITITPLLKSIILFILIIVLIGFFQVIMNYMTLRTDFWSKIALNTSTIGNKNLLASVLFLGIPFLFSALNMCKKWKIIALVTLASSLFLILIIQTRAVWASIVISALTFLIVYKQTQFLKPNNKDEYYDKRFTKYFFRIFIVFICCAAFILILKNITSDNIIQTKTISNSFTSSNNTNTFTTRIYLWKNSIEIIKDNPITGIGLGNWQIYFPKYGLQEFSSVISDGLLTYQRPHNDFLWIWSEFGITGIILFILIFFQILYYSFKLFKDDSINVSERYFFLVTFLMLVGYIFISLVDFPLERIEHQIILMLLFSIVIISYHKRIISKVSNKKFSTFFIFSLLITVVFSILISSYRILGEYHMKKLYQAHSNGNWEGMIKEAEKANNYFYNMDLMSIPVDWYKGVGEFSLGKIDLASETFRKALSIHPYNIHILNNLGSCYEVLGNHNEAIELYNRALQISPNFSETLLNISAVYYNTNDFDKAFEFFNKCEINTKDKKYSQFLIYILKGKLKKLIVKHSKNILVNIKLKELLNNDNDLILLYKNSKLEKTDFENYVIQ